MKIINSMKGLVSFLIARLHQKTHLRWVSYMYKVTNLDRMYFSALVVVQRQLEKSI